MEQLLPTIDLRLPRIRRELVLEFSQNRRETERLLWRMGARGESIGWDHIASQLAVSDYEPVATVIRAEIAALRLAAAERMKLLSDALGRETPDVGEADDDELYTLRFAAAQVEIALEAVVYLQGSLREMRVVATA